MKSILSFILMSAFAVSGQAQTNEIMRDIYNALDNIKQDLRTSTATRSELVQALDKLREANDIIAYGGSSHPGGGQGQSALKCVAKDNDGREPYQIAVYDLQTFETRKVAGTVMDLQSCNEAIQNIQWVGRTPFLCVARDNDGRAPYSLAAAEFASSSVKKLLTYDSIASCRTSLNNARVSRVAMALCSSRDGDGRAPWSFFAVDMGVWTVRNTGATYNTFEECVRAN